MQMSSVERRLRVESCRWQTAPPASGSDRPTAEVCDGELVSSLRTFVMRRCDTRFIQGLRAPNECHSGQGPPHYGSAPFDARVTRCWSLRCRRVSSSVNPRLGARAWINSGYLSAVFLGVLLRPPTPGQPLSNYNRSHLRDHRMIWGHLSEMSLTIWVTRHWTTDAIVTAAAALARSRPNPSFHN
jgi:hypothetical protein